MIAQRGTSMDLYTPVLDLFVYSNIITHMTTCTYISMMNRTLMSSLVIIVLVPSGVDTDTEECQMHDHVLITKSHCYITYSEYLL